MQNEAGESLKNVILVMHSSGILLPPPSTPAAATTETPSEAVVDTRTDAQKKLWTASRDRIERVLPGFLEEVMANQPEEKKMEKVKTQQEGVVA